MRVAWNDRVKEVNGLGWLGIPLMIPGLVVMLIALLIFVVAGILALPGILVAYALSN